MRSYSEFLARKQKEYGPKFDSSALNPAFVEYFENGKRIEVENTKYNHVRRGTVGVTTGWKPCFLLMSRINCIGSSDTISQDDKVIK